MRRQLNISMSVTLLWWSILVCLSRLSIQADARFEVGFTWKISVDSNIRELIVTIPPFDEFGIDQCVDKVYPLNDSANQTYRFTFIPNCIKDDFIETNIVYREHERYFHRPISMQISVETASTESRSYLIPVNAHGRDSIVLHIPQRIQEIVDVIETIKATTNTRLIARLQKRSSGSGMYAYIGAKNGLYSRRISSPLSSRLVCSSSGAAMSLWEVKNVDLSGGHTILTTDNDMYYLPPASVMNITVSKQPPYTIHTEVAQWVGRQRWSDGLETLRPQIYPSIAPGYHQECFCSLHLPCSNGVSRALISSPSMLITKQDLFDQHKLSAQRFQNTLSTMAFGNSDISILNTLLIILAVILCFSVIILLFRDAGGILPDTPESRRFERSFGVGSGGLPYDGAEKERMREIAYARSKKTRGIKKEEE